jgi:hypothetical protein
LDAGQRSEAWRIKYLSLASEPVLDEGLEVVLEVRGQRGGRLSCLADRLADEPLPPGNPLLASRRPISGCEDVGAVRDIPRKPRRDGSRRRDRQLGRVADKQRCVQIAHVAMAKLP